MLPLATSTFWRWRWKQGFNNALFQLMGVVFMLTATAFFITKYLSQKNQFKTLIPFLLDPFFIGAVVILVFSQLDLDFMEYKVHLRMPTDRSAILLYRRHKEVPKLYETTYGNDLFLRAWKIRFIYIIFACIALINWFHR